MGALVPLNFFECVPVLGPPCCVDSQPQGQTLLCVCVCARIVVFLCLLSIFLLAFNCLVGSIIFRLVLFVQYILHVTSWYPEISLGILLYRHCFCWFWLKSSFCCYATSRWSQLPLAHIFYPLLSPDQFLPSFP